MTAISSPDDVDVAVVALPGHQYPYGEKCDLSREMQSVLFHYDLRPQEAEILANEGIKSFKQVRLANPDGDEDARDLYAAAVHDKIQNPLQRLLMKNAFRRMIRPNPFAAVGEIAPLKKRKRSDTSSYRSVRVSPATDVSSVVSSIPLPTNVPSTTPSVDKPDRRRRRPSARAANTTDDNKSVARREEGPKSASTEAIMRGSSLPNEESERVVKIARMNQAAENLQIHGQIHSYSYSYTSSPVPHLTPTSAEDRSPLREALFPKPSSRIQPTRPFENFVVTRFRDTTDDLADLFTSSKEQMGLRVDRICHDLVNAYPGNTELDKWAAEHFILMLRKMATNESILPHQKAPFVNRVAQRLLCMNDNEPSAVPVSFVQAIVKEELIYPKYVKTLAALDFYRVDPIVVVDVNAHRSRDDYLADFVKRFSPVDLHKTLEEMAKMAQMPLNGAVEYLRSKEDLFPPEYPFHSRRPREDSSSSSDPSRRLESICGRSALCHLMRDVCQAHSLLTVDRDCPGLAKRVLARETIEAAANLFRRGGMEMSDFSGRMSEMMRLFHLDAFWLVKNVAQIFPDAARHLCAKYECPPWLLRVDENVDGVIPPEMKDLKFVEPLCVENRKLHDLVLTREIVDLSDSTGTKWRYFFGKVASSKTVAALLNVVTIPSLGRNEVQCLSIRCDDAVGLLPLRNDGDEEMVLQCLAFFQKSTIGKAIATRFLGTWDRFMTSRKMKDFFSNLVDVDDVIHELRTWSTRTGFAAMSQKLTDGPYCHRACAFRISPLGKQQQQQQQPPSQYLNNASRQAWRHEAIRVSLIHLFADEHASYVNMLARERKS